jgi:hypothetical protein
VQTTPAALQSRAPKFDTDMCLLYDIAHLKSVSSGWSSADETMPELQTRIER